MERDQVAFSGDALRGILTRDDVDTLENALDKGLDPKLWLDLDSSEALLAIAILEASVKCVALLLESGGDWALVAPFDEDLDAPLSLAVRCGSDEILDIFIQKNIVEKYSKEWLREAVGSLMDRGKWREQAVAFLEAVASRPEGLSQLLDDFSLIKSLGKKAESFSKSAATTALTDRWSVIARTFLDAENQVESILIGIEEMAYTCHVGRAKKLLKSLPLAYLSEGAGRALVYATRSCSWEFAEDLLAMDADCTIRLADGSTALMYATMGGNLGLIRKLLARGADLYARQDGPNRESAIEMAETPLVRRYLEKVAARDSK
jgi:ankyrin repeat protein